MNSIKVCSLEELPSVLSNDTTHVLTLIDPEVYVFYVKHVFNEFGRKNIDFLPWLEVKRIDMLDVEGGSDFHKSMEAYVPNSAHVAEIIKFAEELPENSELVVHCWAGVSRSTAAALIILYIKNGKDIDKAISDLLTIRSIAQPNKLICKLADDIMGDNTYPLYVAALSLESELMAVARAPVDLL